MVLQVSYLICEGCFHPLVSLDSQIMLTLHNWSPKLNLQLKYTLSNKSFLNIKMIHEDKLSIISNFQFNNFKNHKFLWKNNISCIIMSQNCSNLYNDRCIS